jgi:hypothetical protein
MRVNEYDQKPNLLYSSDTARTAVTIMRDLDTGIVPIIENGVSRNWWKRLPIDLCIVSVCGETIGLTPENIPRTPSQRMYDDECDCCRPEDRLEKALDLMKESGSTHTGCRRQEHC